MATNIERGIQIVQNTTNDKRFIYIDSKMSLEISRKLFAEIPLYISENSFGSNLIAFAFSKQSPLFRSFDF